MTLYLGDCNIFIEWLVWRVARDITKDFDILNEDNVPGAYLIPGAYLDGSQLNMGAVEEMAGLPWSTNQWK